MGIQLWDLERLVELFFDCYDNLPEDSQKLVPLRQIWVLDNPQAAE